MLRAFTDWLFDPAGLTAHGFCLLWTPGLIWTHAVSDGAIGIAYFSIPFALAVIARQRKDLIYRPVFWLFAAFILLCGLGHWMMLLTLWVPSYGLEGVIKAGTAVVSIVTAAAMWRLLPHALALPSSNQLRDVHKALLVSEERHRISFKHSPVPVYLLDQTGRMTGVSQSWLALFGYDEAEVIGRPLRDFGAPGSAVWVAADVAELNAKGELHEVGRQFLSRSGEVIESLVSARIERNGTATWIVCVLVDVTARRRAEQSLRVSQEHLHQAQKMEAIGQLTGGIAHDINNMLQGISGSLDLIELRIEKDQPGDAGRHVRAARQTLERAAGLTHRMLAFARRQALLPMPIKPDRLVHGMGELIQRTVGPAVQVRIALHDGAWLVLCDANQLESAVLNLAINARDAMPNGGELTITTAERPFTDADLSDQHGLEPGEFVEIAVTDTGVGMTPDVLARAFEPFFTTKPTGQGTGLGLSQLHGFVSQSGGFVRLESRVGHGTTVRIHLPRQAACPSLASADQDASGPDISAILRPLMATAGTVLVVEDEESVRTTVVETLEHLGCKVISAADGAAALRVLQSGRKLDLLLTDIGLPGLNGRQLADAARESRADLPIILMTGYAGTALDKYDFAPGIELLNKPFPLHVLAGRVETLLKMKVREVAAT